MATIRYFDAKGAISKQSLLGETGYLALADLFDYLRVLKPSEWIAAVDFS
jgi:hypothetical protein